MEDSVQAILGSGELSVQELVFSERLHFLVIVLGPGVSRAQLESIQPDTTKALSLASKDEVVLAIVTTNGGETKFSPKVSYISRNTFCA